MKKLLVLLVILMVIFPVSAGAVFTVKTETPHIYILASDLPNIRARTAVGGAHRTRYVTLTNWCSTNYGNRPSSSSSDWYFYLTRYAAAHILDPEGDDTYYGERLISHLVWLNTNGTGIWSRTADHSRPGPDGDDEDWATVPAALAMAVDWVWDLLNDGSHNTERDAVVSYLYQTTQSSFCSGGWSGSGCISYQDDVDASTWHKTEEGWALGLPLAIAGRGTSTQNANIAGVLNYAEGYIDGSVPSSSPTCCANFVGSYSYIVPDGMFLYSDGYEQDPNNAMHHLIAWYTAQDGTNDISQWKWWCNRARGMLALLPPNGRYPKSGEQQPVYTGAYMSSSNLASYTAWYLGGAYFCGETPGGTAYLDAIEAINPARANDRFVDVFHLIWTTGTENYSTLDRVYHYYRNGGFAFRSGWNFGSSSTDIVGEIRGFKPYTNDHLTAGSGHLDLRRGADYMLIQAGTYTGGTYNQPYSDCYSQASDSANTVHVGNIRHRTRNGGISDSSCSALSSQNSTDCQWGCTNRLQFVDGNYVYGRYDLTGAFPTSGTGDVTAVYRSLAFLDDKHIFVHDYVNKASSSDSVRIFWNMQVQPYNDGTAWPTSATSSGHDSTDSTMFNFTRGASRIWVRVVEPTSGYALTKVGGSETTSHVTVRGTALGGYPSLSSYADYGLYKVETKIANPGTTALDFLHTIQLKSSGSSESPVTRLASGNYVGAFIADTVRVAAMFSSTGSDYSSCSFTAPVSTGTMKAVVANLTPGTYNVNGSGSYDVDSDGVLYFTANLATTTAFVVAQGGVEGDPPGEATNPVPPNGSTGRLISQRIGWDNGAGTDTVDVYFGTDSTPDADELVVDNQPGTISYNPGTLQYSTTYYWRIDTRNEWGTTTGAVWNFTTQAYVPPEVDPVVSVTANGADGIATETPGDTGKFTISCSEQTLNDCTTLVVGYTLSGTASAADYNENLSGGTVTIVNKDTPYEITITPVDDDLDEGQETLVFTLNDGVNYDVDPVQNSATIAIVDNDLTRWGDYCTTTACGDTQNAAGITAAASRCMGGTSFNIDDMNITAFNIYTSPTSYPAPGPARFAVYQGGSLTAGPAGATLVWDTGTYTPTDGTLGWKKIPHPSSALFQKNTVTWLCWKHQGYHSIYDTSVAADRGDFQLDRGRWNSVAVSNDPSVAYPGTWPSDSSGSFGTTPYYYSLYVDYAIAPPQFPQFVSATIGTDGSKISIVIDQLVTFGPGGTNGFSLNTDSSVPTNLQYDSGSGTSTLVYAISRTILPTETITLNYTQPSNGVESPGGSDMGSFSTKPVSNQSLRAPLGLGIRTSGGVSFGGT